MVDFGRQASLNNRKFESLAQAIAHKDPKDVQAIIAFEPDAVTGEPQPNDLFHDEIEKMRAGAEEYLARASQKQEINEHAAEELIKGKGRIATVVVHDNGSVTANAIFAANLNAADRQRIQNEVDGLLQDIQRTYRVVKNRGTARWR